MSKHFEVHPLSGDLPYGVEVRGLDVEQLSDPEIRADLRDHWIQDGLILFRDMDGEAHLKLSRVFGKLIGHPVQPSNPAKPEILTIRHNPDDAYIVEINGKTLSSWLPWHTDLVHVDKINHGGILRPIAVPEHGGETGFIDKISTYAAMPQRLKDRIDDLEVIYQFNRNPSYQTFGRTADVKVLRESKDGIMYGTRVYPRVVHPMTYTQIETGRKVLNVSPWSALGIVGMPKDEGDALLHEVMGYATDPRFAYFHRWKLTDMVLWDNWRLLHAAAGCRPEEQRWMERTTIEGDYGMGRLFEEETIDDSHRVEV